MSTPRLTESVRRRFAQFLSDDRPDPERWIGDLEALGGLERAPACASVVRLLFHLDRGEDDARRLLVRLLAHRARLEEVLDRDPGIRVAGLDLLANLEGATESSAVASMEAFELVASSVRADALTGIKNRRDFLETLDREIRRARRYGVPLTVVLLDLDDFKSVNDTWGHLVGDQVLQRTASLLRRAIREPDAACRLGGEAFAIVLPETDRIGAQAVVERVRHAIEEAFARQPLRGREVPVTVSGGVSCCPEDGLTRAMLLARADAALDAAKRGGRNRIVLYHDEKRASFRFPARPSTWLEVAVPGEARLQPARLLDLSSRGACVETTVATEGRGTIRMIFAAPSDGPGRGGEVLGRIARVEPGDDDRTARVALAFERPLPEDLLRRHAAVAASGAGCAGSASR